MEEIRPISAPPPNGIQTQAKLPGVIDIPIVHTLYEAYRLWHTVNMQFPKSERYTLGEQCGRTLLQVLEHVLGASGARDVTTKLEQLHAASVELDMLRLLIRLGKDCACLSNRAYLDLQAKLHQAGKMLGGWIKSC